jgi:hypothetical protein
MPISGGCWCGNVRYEIAAEAPIGARQWACVDPDLPRVEGQAPAK